MISSHCVRCRRAREEPVNIKEARTLLKTGKTYFKWEKAHKYSLRPYCAFCGKWNK